MKKRLFVVSDIHGHYTQLKKALQKAGFDPENEGHLFVSCGDLFDRGPENRKIYHFVRRLKHKILIRGNHDERLLELLSSGKVGMYDMSNGTLKTVEEFFGSAEVDDCGRLQLPKHGKMAGNLRRFVETMTDYFETENYIFTHGFLPLEPDSNVSTIRADWRTADADAWHEARWLQWNLLYSTSARVPGKTIVCGHRSARYGHFFDPQRDPEDHGIFYGEGVIAIDALTVRSGMVNVLVLEEEVPEE